MGGRGASSSVSQGTAALPNEGSIELFNQKHRSGGNRWKATILNVEEKSPGVISVSYASPERYDNVSRNTTDAYYRLDHAIYDQIGNRDIQTHGVNMDAVTQVSGKTFEIRGWLKSQGYRWNGESWVR